MEREKGYTKKKCIFVGELSLDGHLRKVKGILPLVIGAKKENFKSPEDAIVNFIGYINSFEMVKTDNGYYNVPAREFLESISKRYRLYVGEKYGYQYIFGQVPALYSYKMEEIDYNS